MLATAACGDNGDLAVATTSTSAAEVTSTTAAHPSPTTTTAAAVDCSFTVGELHDRPEACWPAMVAGTLASEGVTITEADADTQGRLVCRRFSSSDPTTATLTVLADWETGAVPVSVQGDDRGTLLAAAVAVYCPEFYDSLTPD